MTAKLGSLTKPLGNNVLIEVQRDYDGVSRSDDNESMKYGRIIDANIVRYHLTASSAVRFEDDFLEDTLKQLKQLMMNRSTVRWEEFAEGGQTFEENGKTYALIPWWRLIGVSDEQN